MEVTPPLFEAPKTYTATIKLTDIVAADGHKARSRTRRSIEAFGQLTLPLLRELYPADAQPEQPPYFEVIDGSRRIADMRDMDPDGSVEAKVLPHEVSKTTAAAMAVSLNFNRAFNPMQEAAHFSFLREQGYDLEDIASMLGISRSKVQRRMGLIDNLAEELRYEASAGRLAIGVAEQLSRLSQTVQKRVVAKLQSGEVERITADDVAEQLRIVRSEMLPQGRMFEVPKDDHRRALVAQLRELRQQGLSHKDALSALDEVYDDAS